MRSLRIRFGWSTSKKKASFAVHEVRESVEQLGRERRRPFDLVSFLQEFQRRLEISGGESHVSRRYD